MIIEILLVVAVLVIGLVIFIATRPADFLTVRSACIPAPPATIFAEVNDLHRWEAWSPWARLDPSATNTYDGPADGVGSSMHWRGNNKVGEGRMTIVASQPHQLVRLKLEFLKPFVAVNDVDFTFEPGVEGTLVTWSMTGRRNFMFKAMGLLVDCDKMCGDMFMQGLANLRAIVTSDRTPVATR